MKTKPSQNRRKVPRLKISHPVIITYLNNQHQGMIRNLSRNGLSIYCAEILPFEEDYEFQLSFPENLAIRAKGELLWRVPEGAAYIYGVKIYVPQFIPKIKFMLFIRKNLKKNRAVNRGLNS
ncbi:MAG: PilZ domain-containing protein [Desulfobacteraceae bacterium]|nr:MAG: PilZ domain-containing protein [Desulfobacteraceae bacterium]